MKTFAAIVLFLSCCATAQTAQQQSPPAQKATPSRSPQPASPPASPEKAKVQRVHVSLDGFELDKKSTSQMGMTQIGGGSRGGGGAIVTLYAPKRGRVFSLTPTFYWATSSSNQNFLFRMFDESGDVGYEARVTGLSTQYPASAAPKLEPGKTYSWTVESTLGFLGGAATPVEFVVLDEAARKALATELDGADPVKRADIFTTKRFWYDAIQAYSELISQHPDDPEFYERRGEIYDQLPVTAMLARSDFAKADQLRAKQ
jgi:uncharacterized protein DUF928